jgi:hypothetical protein
MVQSAVMDLFDHALAQRMAHEVPLAARMRPCTLDKSVGQEHLIGTDRLQRPRVGQPRALVVLDSAVDGPFPWKSRCGWTGTVSS